MTKIQNITNQKQIALTAFAKPKTMLQVSQETGILRANLCRYIAKWKRTNRIALQGFGLCPISKHRAGFYTTNLNSKQNYGRG